MVTVQLFTNSKSDNLGRMGLFSSLTEQNSYFNGLSKISITGTMHEDMGYIEVQKTLTDVMGYSYGRYQISGTWIYFSVRDFEVVNPTKTRILYDVDCWETCRHQYDMTLGRGHVYRSSRMLSTRSKRPIAAKYGRTHILQTIGRDSSGNSQGCGICYVHSDEDNTNTVYLMPVSENLDHITEYVGGSWIAHIGLPNINEVIGAWFSPFTPSLTGWTQITPLERVVYKCDIDDLSGVSMNTSFPLNTATATPGPITGDDYAVMGITDARGQIVWTCDSSDDFYGLLQLTLNIGPSSCSWSGFLHTGTVQKLEKVLEGQITIPCEPTDVWNDAFSAYQAQQRAYDMSIRSLNNDRQLVNSLSSIGSNAVGGAIAGAAAGGVGAIGGAVLGTVGGIVGSLASYVSAPAFDAREQQITDDYYRRQTDTLAQSGNPLLSILNGTTYCWLVETEIDPDTAQIYNDNIAAGGYYYDVETSDMEDWLIDGSLSADVEVLGSIPTSWKEQIRQRFANGVILS